MKPFIELIRSLIKLRWHGTLTIKFFDGKISHVEKLDSLDTEPLNKGWNQIIPGIE